MEEHLDLLPVALLLVGAVAGGLLFAALRQPPLVGYIIAGAMFGPSGLGLITDRATSTSSPRSASWCCCSWSAPTCRCAPSRTSTGSRSARPRCRSWSASSLMLLLAQLLDWRPERAILYGFVLALSSTAVGIKILEDIGELRTETGRCRGRRADRAGSGGRADADHHRSAWRARRASTSPADAQDRARGGRAGRADLGLEPAPARSTCRFARLLVRYPDLAPVGALALCVIGAALSGALELSAGLGAFLAGLYVGNTTERAVMVRAMDPIQNLLLMMFFLSVGLSDRPDIRVAQHRHRPAADRLVFLLNSVINVLALRTVGAPWRVALLAGFALAQIGEFAFVLAAAGVASGLIGEEAQRVVVAVIALTMIMSPLWLELARRLHACGCTAEGLPSLVVALWRAEGVSARGALRARWARRRIAASLSSGLLARSLGASGRVERAPSRPPRRRVPPSRPRRHDASARAPG